MPRIASSNEDKLLKKFEKINDEWRERVMAMPLEELKTVLVEVAKSEAANQDAKEEDTDLASAKETYDTAKAGYSEATQINRLKIKFALRCLEAKGG